MERDRDRWNERYGRADGFLLGTDPSPFLAASIELLKEVCPGRRALDVACGEGRNSVFLARNGFSVTGIDIADKGLAKGASLASLAGVPVTFHQVDLEKWQPLDHYDLVLNINFLLRDLVPHLVAALSPGGIFLFDTLVDLPGVPPTTNPLHLLQPGELVRLFDAIPGTILHAEEGGGGSVPTARLLFRAADRES